MVRVLIYIEERIGYNANFSSMREAKAWADKHHANDGTNVEIINESEYDRERKMKSLISRRDKILQATDWLFMSDVKTDQKHRRAYMEYRQYLRDLPNLLGNKEEISIEEFPHWLRRKHPEEFMDGGENEVILHRFMYYYK